MPRFPRRRAPELEENVRRRIFMGHESDPQEASPEELVELIRVLADDLKRRGVDIQEIKAGADRFSVRGMASDRPIDEWFPVSALRAQQERQATANSRSLDVR